MDALSKGEAVLRGAPVLLGSFHAFLFVALALSLVVILAGGRYGPPLAAVVPPVILVYHFASLRRVFGGSRLQTAWKGILIWIIYSAMVLAVVLAIGLQSLKP